MKNIHILPTDKPSRLGYLTKKGKEVFNDLRLFKKPMPIILDSENQNIYITSDEEIKFNDYITDGYLVWKWKDDSSLLGRKKVILTTDQDLIKYGVQAIDDEFLEWFCKYSSCERVEVKKQYITPLGDVVDFCYDNERLNYKIIIPKEEVLLQSSIDGEPIWGEPKKTKNRILSETSEETKQKARDYANSLVTKQETLEEAIQKYFPFVYDKKEKSLLIRGAKWQQEKMYNEEEDYDIVQKAIEESSSKQLRFFDGGYSNPVYNNLKKWFEQFKNK